ncbi:hypothetical protein BCR42DRAFT_423911 [Absidia repens]|uniref:Uncharacterized protein n=1 Tax=Absidia repens TaxID=90262 RepID=A0A1X2I4Q8_9FUNG|nr:hypothetical protein BCR42DRAFT_423911 [Absidia repens]
MTIFHLAEFNVPWWGFFCALVFLYRAVSLLNKRKSPSVSSLPVCLNQIRTKKKWYALILRILGFLCYRPSVIHRYIV